MAVDATLHAAMNSMFETFTPTAPAKLATAARIGIGGPVGSGKTALIERLIPLLHARGVDLAVVTNDLVTHEDAERVLFESGGDNLASTFSLDLVDWWIFVIDVAGGDDIPRKRGPGVIRSDLLVVNKIDLAPHVGVDLPRMLAEASAVRNGAPVVATDLRHGEAVEAVADAICAAVLFKA